METRLISTTIVVHTCDMRTRPRQHGGYPFIYCLFPDFKLRAVANIPRATTSIPNSYANPPNKYHECVGKTTSPGTRIRVKARPLVSVWGVAGGGPISYQGTIIMPPKRNLPPQTWDFIFIPPQIFIFQKKVPPKTRGELKPWNMCS